MSQGNLLEYIKVRMYLGLLREKEYKASLYTALLAHITFTVVIVISTLIVISNFSFFEFSSVEIVFLILHSQMLTMFYGFLKWGDKLHLALINGDMNNFLTKPMNIFVQYILHYNLYVVFLLTVIDLFFLILVGLFFGILNFKYLLVLFLSILGGVMFILFFRFFDSLAFFMKNNKLIARVYYDLDKTYNQFPFFLFEGVLKKVGLLVGYSIYALLPILWYFNKIELSFVLKVNFYVFLICLVLGFAIYFLWEVGLKKYEAFG